MAIVKVTKAMAQKALSDVDWVIQDALTDADVARQTAENPDAAPILSGAETAAGIVRLVRHRLGLSQAAFAHRYGIPVGTLRDWEQSRKAPDRTAFAYLKVIAKEPEIVARALSPAG